MSSTVSLEMRQLMVASVFTPGAVAIPSSLWMCLTYDVAASNSFGSFLSEPLFGGYARASYSLGSDRWITSGFGEVMNSALVEFPRASMDWGLVQGWAMTDSATVGAGKTYAVGSLVTPTYISAGTKPSIVPGGITVGLYD